MKISVITVVFNRRDTIGQTIKSLQCQTFGNYEHIIVDGGSTDGTVDIIQRHMDSKTNFSSGPDEGIFDAINTGVGRATGDVIGLMHSDDFYDNNYVLEKIAQAFEDENVSGVYGDLDYISASDSSRLVRHWVAGIYHSRSLSNGWMPPHTSLYVRKELYEKYGNYNTSYGIAADYDAIIRWLRGGETKLAYIPEVFVKMRTGGISNRSLGDILQKTREDYQIIRRNKIGGLGTLVQKNLRKVGQFFVR